MTGSVDAATPDEPPTGTLVVGSRVEVRSAFDGSWAKGFEVAEITDRGYRIRRRSDGSVLPADFEADDVRRERRTSMWWI